MNSEQTLRDAVTKLRDIADALRSTNLIRGRQLHQLADDFDRALAQPTGSQPPAYPEIPSSCVNPIVFRDKNLGMAMTAHWGKDQWIFKVVNGRWMSVRTVSIDDPTFILEPLNRPPEQPPAPAAAPQVEAREFNDKWRLVSSNRPISDGKTYQLEGETLVTCNVGAWYETAVYWKHRALASEASKPVREMSPWEYMNRGAE